MADVVNLRTSRKRAVRQQQDLRAAENRLAYGRPKAAAKLETARTEKTRRDLDAHRIGDDR